MMRIGLFLLTNFAVLVIFGLVMAIFGDQLALQGQYTQLLIFSAIFGFTGSFISLFLSKSMAKRAMGVQIITDASNQDELWLLNTVNELSQRAKIKMPEVGIFPGNSPNAFATGWNRNDALVAVNTALLRGMKKNEVKAVLAHEIAHVANGDMVTLTLIQGVMNTFVLFFSRIVGAAVDRAVFKGNGRGMGYFAAYMMAQIVFGILAQMIVSWFSRKREYRADEGGALYADRQSMIDALQRLKTASEHPEEMPDNMQAMGISAGLRQGFGALFATHPPLDDRIAVLRSLR